MKNTFARSLLNESLKYASEVQTVILPEVEELKSFFYDCLILYLPKDTVSGDFYWFKQIKPNIALFVLGDCTGHGVPGAFMSLLGCTLLNEIVNHNCYTPSLILEKIHERIRTLLKQERGKNRDGMDISVCLFEKNEAKKTVLFTFSGAKSAMYYAVDNNVVELKGDKQYIGGRNLNTEFMNQTIELPISTPFYLFTDGYIDQNNEQRDKFGSKKFKKIIAEHHQYTFDEQKIFLMETLKKHQNKELQRDDITVIALKCAF